MRSRTRSGTTIVELTIAMGVIAVLVSASCAFVATNSRVVTLNQDRSFAVQKATMMIAELRGVAEQPGTQAADTLDSYDDGAGTSSILCVDTTVVDPAHEFSQNVQVEGRWRYARRVTVRKFPSLDTRDVRIVTARVYLTSAVAPDDTVLADVTSVINTVATAYPPSQVYDTYLLAMENVPGWWVYMSYIKPFIENSLDDMEARQPGLVFRRHWITKLGYGRDPLYQPYFNKAADSNAVINSVYFYPGTMPAGSAVDQYYVPDKVTARINVDGATVNDYDVTTNPWPYSLADQFNHCARQPVEQAIFNQRLAAGQEASDTLTWHLLLDDMIKSPNKYRNAIFINLHGELVPFPPVRNYSDPAKAPKASPNVRVVTHPQKLCFAQGDPLVLRVYGYYEDGGGAPSTTNTAAIAAAAATITVSSTTGFPTRGVIGIEGNLITYGGTTATTFTGCGGAVAHPFTGTTVSGGTVRTDSSAAIGAGAATITVASTSQFPTSGWIGIEGNIITYTGTTATTFTGCQNAVAHATNMSVYGGVAMTHGGWSIPMTAAVAGGGATITVSRTDGFLASGQLLIEGNVVNYTGVTATTFTGCTNVTAHAIGEVAYQYLGRPSWLATPISVFLPGLDLSQAGDVSINDLHGGTDVEPNDRIPDPYGTDASPATAGTTGATRQTQYSTVAYQGGVLPGTIIQLYNTPLRCPASAPVPVTTNTAAITAGAATITVASTAGFPPSGQISCQGDIIGYAGLTTTTFTGCTDVVAHAVTQNVYLEDVSATTTTNGAAIAAGNGVTITVTSTASFPPTGQIDLEEDLITYTGSTATTFTGCNVGVAHAAVVRTVFHVASTPSTTNTVAILLAAATITVQSTAGFPSAGQIRIEANPINYTGITATTFTGCTGAVAHAVTKPVFQSNAMFNTTTLSNAAAAATISVNSTAGFPSSGRINLEGDLITYTGTTATTFTGCSGALAHASAGRELFLVNTFATATTAANAAAATTISVASTSGFPGGGWISLEGNVIAYTGTTATSFTGCTGAVAHATGTGVRRPVIAVTDLKAAVAAAAVTITVLSTALFAPAGQLRLETDTVTYTGKTATTFTGCSGVAAAHATGVTLYQANTGLPAAWRLYGDEYVPCSVDGASTTCTAAVAAAAGTITVGSTTNFPTAGQISIEGNLITYTGTTATTFTGCLGAIAHANGATVDFCRNLVSSADTGKNTARWVITIAKAALDRATNDAHPGLGAGTEAVVSIETRLGNDLTTGASWPTAIQPTNLSTTYAWRSNNTLYAAAQNFVPFSERYQFQGDPRHCPYSDVKAGHGYNWYFDNMRDATTDTRAGTDRWPGFDTARIRNTGGTDYDGWHGSGTNGTTADSNEVDVPRYFQWMRNGLCTSNSIYTTLTGFSYYYMGNGNEIGYDSANGFATSIPTNPKPFTGSSAGIRYEDSITDAQTGGVKLIRENAASYWWSKPWMGELYPDTMAATWIPADGSVPSVSNGNLPSGTTANTFIRIRRQDITAASARAGSLPTGTTFSDHRTVRRLNAKGCTSFFNIGTATATFRHEYRDGTTGNLSTGGNELDATYNFPIPSNTKISRPFRLDYNTTTDEFSQAEYVATRASASNLLVYYAHQDITPPWNGSALLREQLLASNALSPSCFVAVNGIDRTVETGSAFIATFSGLTLIHTFLSAGLPGTQSQVTELPQIVIKQPNDSTELKNPNTVTIQWSSSWFRWDGLRYTPQYAATFTGDDTVLKYALLYSIDNGQTWLHMVDNSPATLGVPDQTLLVADAVAAGDETYIWDVTNQVYLDEASYLIRVEAYRSTNPADATCPFMPHYSFHQQKIFIAR